MKELKCPHCGQVFQVDEADYASIVSQVKNAEFERELSRLLKEQNERIDAEQKLAAAKSEQFFQQQLNQETKRAGRQTSGMGTSQDGDELASESGDNRTPGGDLPTERTIGEYRVP